MANKLDLADAQFIGYSHGRVGSLIEMVEAMGLTKKEWEEWKLHYPRILLKREVEEIDYYIEYTTIAN